MCALNDWMRIFTSNGSLLFAAVWLVYTVIGLGILLYLGQQIELGADSFVGRVDLFAFTAIALAWGTAALAVICFTVNLYLPNPAPHWLFLVIWIPTYLALYVIVNMELQPDWPGKSL